MPNLDMAVGQDMSVPADLGPGDMSIPNDASKPVLFSQFVSDYTSTICVHLAQCGRVNSDAASQAACREVNALHYARDFDAQIMAGHLVVNELQCLDAIMNMRCDGSDFGILADKCNKFLFQPRQQAGQSCLNSEECVNGYCAHALNGAGTALQPPGCPGTCSAYQTTACKQNDSCDPTLAHCNGTTCIALGDENQPCSNGCKPGLYCSTFTGNCVKPAMQMLVGGACDPFQALESPVPPCMPGLYCQYTSAAHTAATCQMKQDVGGPCDKSLFQHVTDNPCKDGYRCDTTGSTDMAGMVGVCRVYGGMGAACTPPGPGVPAENVAPDCKVNFYCDRATSKCLPLSADGTACSASETCLAYLGANFSKAGFTCLPENPDAGTYNTCQPYENFGGSCLPGSQDHLCFGPSGPGTGYCAPNKNGGGSCAPNCN